MSNMIALTAWAKEQDISTARARVLADEGRLKGAQKIGRNWIVPKSARYKKLKPGKKT